jgi:hypothetical protein
MRSKPRADYPTHPFAGSNSERQSIGLPGHCERCAELGHVKAHPSLGCGDVGCERAHGDAQEAAARVPAPAAGLVADGNWRALRERLIRDVADYREARDIHARSQDGAGRERASGKVAAASRVLDLMDEFERASLPGRRVAESESAR